jgi:ABC-type sugar transport system permease subunit
MKRKAYSLARIHRSGYWFVLPTVVLFCVFSIFPMLNAFHISTLKWDILGEKAFVGLRNYRKLIGDDQVFNSLGRTIHFSVISVTATNLFGLLFALMFTNKLVKYRNVLQSLIFLPVVLSSTAIAVVWRFMFQANGIMSVASTLFAAKSVPWLTSVRVTPYSLILVHFWQHCGFPMVIYIAGIINIPDQLYEAARIDGAGAVMQFARITVPGLRNTFALSLVTSVIGTFGAFNLQYVVTQGGPSRSTEVISLLIYQQAFEYGRLGYAVTIAIFFFVILMSVSLVQLRLFRSESFAE